MTANKYEYKIDCNLDTGEYYLVTIKDREVVSSKLLSLEDKLLLVNTLLHEISINTNYNTFFEEDSNDCLMAHCSDGKILTINCTEHEIKVG